MLIGCQFISVYELQLGASQSTNFKPARLPHIVQTSPTRKHPLQIVELLAGEKGWWQWKKKAELKRALAFLETFDPAPPTKDPTADSPRAV